MLDFTWDNLDQAIEDLIKDEITPIIRGLAVYTWSGILHKTPQYFGRLVASWSFSLNSPQFVDRSAMVLPNDEQTVGYPLPLRWRGHTQAIDIANTMNAGKELSFNLGDTIWFANGADHGDGPYSAFIETVDSNWLRFYNRPGKAVSRTLDGVNARFGTDMTEQAASRMKQLKIGARSDV